MKYIDYREKLGIGFNENEKFGLFKTSILNYFENGSNINFSKSSYAKFCSKVGFKIEKEDLFLGLKALVNTPKNLQLLVEPFSKIDSFNEFICRLMIFINIYDEDSEQKKELIDYVFQQLKEFKFGVETITDEDGIFIFPKGAKELDDALVSQPLEWLKDYPKSRATFCRALKQYSDGTYVRDVADNFRKALEEFLQEFLGNGKNLETNKNEICKYLDDNGADSHINAMLQPLLNNYKGLNDVVAKHNDKLDAKYLEFLMYQTGLFIRMIITTCKDNEEE